MLACLVDHCGREQLRRVELADGEPLEPRFLAAGETVQLCTTNVPQLDVDTVGAALAEEEDGHDSV